MMISVSDISKHFKHTESFLKIKNAQYCVQFIINIIIFILLAVIHQPLRLKNSCCKACGLILSFFNSSIFSF